MAGDFHFEKFVPAKPLTQREIAFVRALARQQVQSIVRELSTRRYGDKHDTQYREEVTKLVNANLAEFFKP